MQFKELMKESLKIVDLDNEEYENEFTKAYSLAKDIESKMIELYSSFNRILDKNIVSNVKNVRNNFDNNVIRLMMKSYNNYQKIRS